MANTIGKLDPFFTNLIKDLMALERQPVDRLIQKRDAAEMQRAVYTDLRGKLDQLQSAVRAMLSTDPFCNFSPGRRVTISEVAAGSTVVSASASSSSTPGSYQLEITALAKEHRVRSDPQVYADQALGLTGTFILGGAGSRSQETNAIVENTVLGFGVAEPAHGQRELGSGAFFVETRNDPAAGWQFRLVDGEGKAVSIRLGDGTSFTSNWQSIPAGSSYDTGRGLTISFGADPQQFAARHKDNGAAQTSYTAQGTRITVEAGHSLNALAGLINSAAYPAGNEVTAAVVNRQLILSARNSGSAYRIQAGDLTGTVLNDLGILAGAAFKNEMQAASDASFKVNGLAVTRSQNTGLSDVIYGVTLNLASDAAGKSATLNILPDFTANRNTISDFLNRFNDLQGYLEQKLAVTKNADGTYKRGSLSGDSLLSNLRSDLFRLFSRNTPNGGVFKNLGEIGVMLDDNMKALLKDSNKLQAALQENSNDVKLLLDAVMSELDKVLSRFTGKGSYVEQSIQMLESQKGTMNTQINGMNERLSQREQSLTKQYAELQAQVYLLQYTQQQVSTINNLMFTLSRQV